MLSPLLMDGLTSGWTRPPSRCLLLILREAARYPQRYAASLQGSQGASCEGKMSEVLPLRLKKRQIKSLKWTAYRRACNHHGMCAAI